MRTAAWARWIGTGLGAVGGFALGYFMVRGYEVKTGNAAIMSLTTLEGFIFAYLGTPYLLGGWRRVNLRVARTPLSDLLFGLFGLIVGLIVAVLIGYFVRDFPYGVALSAVLAALLALAGANLGMTRRNELLALINGSELERAVRRPRLRGALLDTSVIIDGRVLDLARTGFVDAPLLVLKSVLRELQYVADASDPRRRARGRRGLDVLTQLQKDPETTLEVVDDDAEGNLETDARLVKMAKSRGWAILTNDFNLNRVANLEGVKVLNLNELANALKPIAIPGEELTIEVVREGKDPGQGVGYLDDGTMVVIENGRRHLNQTVTATVTSVLQTAAGRMIFAAPVGSEAGRRPKAKAGS